MSDTIPPAAPAPAPAHPAPPAAPEIPLNDQIRNRLAALDVWRAENVEPFGQRYDDTIACAVAKASFKEPSDVPQKVRVAGRVTASRGMGKSLFADVQDSSDRLQLYAQLNHLGELKYTQFKRLDLGDLIGVEGELFRTRQGEITIRVTDFVLLSKSLHPLPDKHKGLSDVEQRHRQRYLDLISNDASRATFQKRFAIIKGIRRTLDSWGFIEVETPMLQTLAGGAAARPFTTHYNALDIDMYLRIAPELYLKRLLVGGFEKVYELNRNFRNEGLSRKHNPEFTMLELYQAYSDCRGMADLIEKLITTVAQEVLGTLVITHADGKRFDLTPPWRRVAYRDLVRETAGADWFERPAAERRAHARSLGLFIGDDWTEGQVTHEIYEKIIESTLIQPTFVTRLPRELVPLAKACSDDPTLVDVYELEINGQEISPGYSELNDPIEQRRRFEEQLKMSGETAVIDGKIDEEFLAALSYGMPPAGGLGMGIDRLVMLLTGAESIREVILFPHLRPK